MDVGLLVPYLLKEGLLTGGARVETGNGNASTGNDRRPRDQEANNAVNDITSDVHVTGSDVVQHAELERLLSVVMRRGPQTFDKLCAALKQQDGVGQDRGQNSLVRQMSVDGQEFFV